MGRQRDRGRMKVLVLYRKLGGGFFTREFPACGLTERRILNHLKEEVGTAPALRRADVVAIRAQGAWEWPPLPKTPLKVLRVLSRELEARC